MCTGMDETRLPQLSLNLDYLLSHIQGQAHFSRDLGLGTKEHPTGRTLITAGLRRSICASLKRAAQRRAL